MLEWAEISPEKWYNIININDLTFLTFRAIDIAPKGVLIMNYTETIRNYFANHKGEIYDSAFERDKLFPMIETNTYGRILLRLEKDNTITCVSKGVYYINNGNECTQEKLLKYYIGNYSGMYIGKSLFEKLGLIQKVDDTITILSRKVKNNKNVGNIKIEKSDISIFMDYEINIISILEIFEHLRDDGSVDTNKLLEIAPMLIHSYREDSFTEIIKNRKYHHSTIMKYKNSLDSANIKNNVLNIFEECGKYE